MDSRSRILTALRGGTPDQIPVAEWSIHSAVIKGLGCTDEFDVIERHELDGVSVAPNGNKTWIDQDTFIDEWGVTKRQTEEDDPMPVSAPLATPSDLLTYVPPDPRAVHHFQTLAKAINRFGGKKAIFFHCRDVFSIPRYLRGAAQILEDLLLEPGLVRDLVELSLEYNVPFAEEAIRRGADVILLTDDYACNTGPMFSPAVFERSFRDGLAKIVTAVHAAGGLVVKHSDGDLMPILDEIVSTGIDALDPIDPLGGMSVARVRERNPDLALKGGVPLSDLSISSPTKVRSEALRCISESGGRGYVLSSSNSITSSVRPENFLAMLDVAKTSLDLSPEARLAVREGTAGRL